MLVQGNGKGTRYSVSPSYELNRLVDMQAYFEREQDDRKIKEAFDFSLMSEILPRVNIFTTEEYHDLHELQSRFEANIKQLSNAEYSREMERLAIDLSWKSSQIEGNTYSLLETERLLKEKLTATGKPKNDATVLLNHKDAISFITENPDYVVPLSVKSMEDIHSLLIKDLGVDRNIRQKRVGITGTNYKPLDNEHQIRKALEEMCQLINSKENVFDKAFLALVLLSYIQAFNDGNKRTARVVSNAILIAYNYCPVSFRTVDSIDYKKAMLVFYETGNLSQLKKIFISQFEFAVQTYF